MAYYLNPKEVLKKYYTKSSNVLVPRIKKAVKSYGLTNGYIYLDNTNNFIANISISNSPNEETDKTLVCNYSKDNLEELIAKHPNIMTAEFCHYQYDGNALLRPYGRGFLMKQKGVTEIASFIPSPSLKNSLFRMLGMSVSEKVNTEATVSPHTLISYDSACFAIGPGAYVGEGAYLFEHTGFPGKFILGMTFIGEKSLASVGSIITPGTIIDDNARVYAGAVVRGYVPPNHCVKANSSYKCLNRDDLKRAISEGILNKPKEKHQLKINRFFN